MVRRSGRAALGVAASDDNHESQGVVEVEAEHPEIVDREETQDEQNAAEEMKEQLVARVSHFDSTLGTSCTRRSSVGRQPLRAKASWRR